MTAPTPPSGLARLLSAHPVGLLTATAGLSGLAAMTLTAVIAAGPSRPAVVPARAPASATPTAQRVDLGRIWGQAFAGRATDHVSPAGAERAADSVPPGAVVDRTANIVRFRGTSAALTVVANPPNGRDMAFRAAGLENPTIVVARGAVVRVRLINADRDSAHGWLLLDPVVVSGTVAHGPWAFAGSYAPILGDPTAAGQPAETITFRATQSGTYRYECPVPGHAAMGMQGAFEVAT